ncbi:MAG: energy transducer TonB [Bacteroidetes bacterium]|nr:MAG: energy transducer TonB [Bacteroidota bacterium]
MEVKKSQEANLERLRIPLFFIGLLFIMSIVLASFTFGTPAGDGNDGDRNKRAANIQTEKIEQEQKQEEEPEQTPPPEIDIPPPPTEETVTKENTKDTVQKTKVTIKTTIPTGPLKPTKEIKAEVIEFPDVEATFPGGPAAMQQWIAKNVKYPQTSIELGEQGKVYVSFVVEPDGAITGVKVERGVSDDLDREAKRLVRNMPKWVPGEAGGKKARTRCRLPINFTLN